MIPFTHRFTNGRTHTIVFGTSDYNMLANLINSEYNGQKANGLKIALQSAVNSPKGSKPSVFEGTKFVVEADAQKATIRSREANYASMMSIFSMPTKDMLALLREWDKMLMTVR